MKFWKKIKFNLKQIAAIIEKNSRLTFRYKTDLIMSFINPLIQLIVPFIFMGIFFSFQENFGPWNQQNFLVYLFIGYNVIQLRGTTGYISASFRLEKHWLTLQALMISPFNRINLLFGFTLTHLINISFTTVLFLILCYIYYPISFLTLLLVLFFLLLLIIIFAGFGFLTGGFAISNENMARVTVFILGLFFTFSCITYPYQIFPDYIQFFINYNPMYYIIDIIRLAWIEDDVSITLSTHPYHLIIIFSLTAITPIFGFYMFNHTFKKHGIVGY